MGVSYGMSTAREWRSHLSLDHNARRENLPDPGQTRQLLPCRFLYKRWRLILLLWDGSHPVPQIGMRLCTQSQPQTYSNPPASASQVRGIYIWTTPWFSKWLLTNRDEPTLPSAFCPIKKIPFCLHSEFQNKVSLGLHLYAGLVF